VSGSVNNNTTWSGPSGVLGWTGQRPRGPLCTGVQPSTQRSDGCHAVSLNSAESPAVWIGSSVKSLSGVEGRVSVVAFERGSMVEWIWESGFRGSELQSILFVVLGNESFCECRSLGSVAFESGSRLERIKRWEWTEID
jgi:hypothetical protein